MAKTYRYYLRSPKYEGWNLVILDQYRKGCHLFVSGSYGQYVAWFCTDEDFREFILDCDGDDILRKISEPSVYDEEETLRLVKKHIINYRRDGYLTKEEAHAEWDRLSAFNHLQEVWDFHAWMRETSIRDPWELIQKEYPAEAKRLVERMLPQLKEAIKKELQTIVI